MNDELRNRFQRQARLLKALAHPLRLEMVCGLRGHPCTQTFIADTLGIPQSSVAQHLKVLRTEGLIRAERRGVEVVFSIADPVVTDIIDSLCNRHGGDIQSLDSWQQIAAIERARRAAGDCC
jgi:DNA-binding transcriptional ArsR family regulator